ncbi:MAG: FHA domain-containing protein [Anaerolineae bacterium]
MAYGRLDVFWPDGQFKTFQLVENNISVGRSTGNSIALETTTISRYHFSLTHEGEVTYITDMESANGTFVDGVRLAANTPRSLGGGEEIQIGDLRIIYHQLDEMPTQPIKIIEETTQRIEAVSPAFRLDVIGPAAPFSPGAHMSAEISITNTSAETQTYRVEVTGMPPNWIRIDRPELKIDAGQSEQVLANFRPLRQSDSRPGDYRVLVRVMLRDAPQQKLDAQMVVRILPYGGFGMALEKPLITSGQPFRLHLHNQGSGSLSVNVTCRNRDNKLRYTYPSNQVTLTPGARFVMQGLVQPLQPALWGKPRQHPFDIQVTSQDAARFVTVARAYYLEKPMLPSWTPLALAGAAVVGLLFLIVIAAALLRPVPPPQISTFTVNTAQVAQGEAINLNWTAQDVSSLSLRLNGNTVIERIGNETTGLTLDTSGLNGNVVLELVGRNGNQQTSANQTVYVYLPLGAGSFTSSPSQLVRYVVQNLTIMWDIPGAVKTRLSGLEKFTNTPTNTEYGAQASVSGLVGIPSETLHFTLMAEDEAGNQQEQTLDVPVINPECSPAGPPVTLYVGPDAGFQVVGTVPTGAMVVVDAQDGSGGWLRAQLPGGSSGWGVRSQFACARTFNPADLVKELNVPTLPPPTITPVPSLTFTPRPSAPAAATPFVTLTPAAVSPAQSAPTQPLPTAAG